MPLILWLGGGRPLNCYLLGFCIHFIFDRIKLRQLVYPVDNSMEHASFFIERTLLGRSLSQWLNYLKWWATSYQSIYTGENPYTILESLLS
uniref:Uncharacterized protein n=1 Tax=Utricularia reniformis TaxID=192314 RepID=A0A1Y0B2N9_9LAMI|nr:hypothetical protein AEK19_MT1522 [Utricularia reniformis]ART31712.1 hypothetical protein AEK19_MT1522 [Utricularia reniformis]